MKLRKATLTIVTLILFFPLTTMAQYGNEWINFNQSYFKIKIGKEGIYRIDYNLLNNAGIPVGSINPKNIQLIHNGQEEPIFIQGESDNSFDPADFIEFYGFYNDGKLDEPLYLKPQDQPHQYSSLYTDTSAYYLTWTVGAPGLRLNSFYNGDYTGKTTDAWIWYRSVTSFNNFHYDGSPYNSPGYHSEYTEGEGWFGPQIYNNYKPNHAVNTELFEPTGPKPEYKFAVYGKSDPTNPGDIVNNVNHEIEASIDGTVIFTKKHRGYSKITNSGQLDASLISSPTTKFQFASIYLTKSLHAVSYIYVDYPRKLDLKNTTSLSWNYTASNTYFKFKNYGTGFSNPIIYDLTNNQRIKGDVNSNILEFNTSQANNNNLFIIDESKITTITSSNFTEVNFIDYDAAGSQYSYLIITHPSLQSSAEQYKIYRESAQGGGYNVLIAYSTDLFDQYYYGVHHPLALKNFCKDFFQNQALPPEYVLLLGKGQQYDRITYNALRRNYEDLVPTWGMPPSDYFFVTDYQGENFKPVMAIGRIPARKNLEVINYLEKVKLHETFGNKSKTMLQLTGGATSSEANTLQYHQDDFYDIAAGQKLGMDKIEFSKSEAVSTSSILVEDIQKVINEGVHTLSYFGHGASQVLEIDIGDAENLNNKGEYPLFLFNGCALGNSFNEVSLPEIFLLQEDVGAVSWIASSAFGYIQHLADWSEIFMHNLYDSMYGESIGKVIQATIDKYQKPFHNYNRSQSRQMTYHGDPAIRLYAPDKPDYEVTNPINIFPEDVNAENDSFALILDVKNYGKSLDIDTPNIYVSVKYFNDTIRNFGPREYRPIYGDEKIYFWIPMNIYSRGIMKFTIIIDSGDYFDELAPNGEFNNIKTFEFFMPSNSIYPLSPYKDAIINESEVRLKVQNNNIISALQEFIFEIDTTPRFNSPLKQSSGIIYGKNIVEHTFLLAPVDSVDYYWRAKFNKPIDEGGVWETSTFSFIYNSEKGWSQGYYKKYLESTGNAITVDTNTRELIYLNAISPKLDIVATGSALSSTSRGIIIGPSYYYPGFLANGIGLIALSTFNFERYMDSSKFNRFVPNNNWGINKKYYYPKSRSGAYWFNTTKQEDRDSLVHFLNKLPDDYRLFLFTSGNTAIDLWEDTLFKAFELYGAKEIRNINNGDPYGLYGQKGWSASQSSELLANYNSIVPPNQQEDRFGTTMLIIADNGTLKSQKIGPARNWTKFYRTITPFDSEEDELLFSVYGIRNDETEQLLISKKDSAQLDLRSIDVTEFPYIRVQAHHYDGDLRTPVQQQRWTVLFDGVPEGSINPDLAYFVSADTLQEGDSIEVKIAYQNISDLSMDSVLVLVYNQDYYGNRDTISLKKYAALAPNEHLVVNEKFHTLGKPLNNRIVVDVNPDMDQLEETLKNNILNIKYHVLRDIRNPLLDVVFDGIHILDHDIVSPNPVISMSAMDENKFILISDPNSFDLELTRENPDGTTDNILVSPDQLVFAPATKENEKAVMEFRPTDLESGTYKFIVSVKDASGNESSELDYQIHFEVVRESSITNFYPYPNPFTTSMRFVYTLTGDQVPDYLKIQIMTVTGKVVREITQGELGPIRIGNNISEFAWNGTDEFGDPLANGVYLYKVTAQIGGEDITQRTTEKDFLFKNGFGKIYLMR